MAEAGADVVRWRLVGRGEPAAASFAAIIIVGCGMHHRI
jgi:hypothetical protein